MNMTNGFNNWWEVYPKKVGKKLSRKIWDRENLDLKAGELIAKLEIQLKLCSRYQNKMYIPDPATYLNQERWDDEIIPIESKLPRTSQPERPKKCQNLKCTTDLPPVGAVQSKYYCSACFPAAAAGDLQS